MDITIRGATRRDSAACARIYNHYIAKTTVTFEETPLSEESFAERLARISARYPFLVAEADGQVVGYAYLDAFNPRTAYRLTSDLSIYLDPNATAQGIGSQLLLRIEAEAARRGLRNVISLVTEENVGSVRFHERHGFARVGRLENVGLKFGRLLDVLFLQKPLH